LWCLPGSDLLALLSGYPGSLGQFLLRSDTPEHADAILVLAAISGTKMLKGAELGMQGFAPVS